MDATLVVIDSDSELARARAVVDRLMNSGEAGDVAKLAAQARLISAYEQEKWPPRTPSPAQILRYLMDQHGLSRADLVPLFGTRDRVIEVLRGQRPLSLAMVQRLRARFSVPADLLLPPAGTPAVRRKAKRPAA